jgi:heptosyltransferase-2
VTSLLETLHLNFPNAKIDIVVRKGNESLFNNHPFIHKIYAWDKSNGKTKNLFGILKAVRKQEYDIVLGVQRFFNAGLLAAFSKGKRIIGFDKNPLSFLFHEKIPHKIGESRHEVERNYDLIKSFSPKFSRQLKLYPSISDQEKVEIYTKGDFIVIAPASVWFTKQFPKDKWIEFLDQVKDIKTYIIGAQSDAELADNIITTSTNKNIINLCGSLNLLQSTALMQKAKMNYVNDSAPQHLASSVNAPTSALFCSTVPEFGFGPLADNATIIEIEKPLECRPCGLHGHKACPKGHFNCANNINVNQLLACLNG